MEVENESQAGSKIPPSSEGIPEKPSSQETTLVEALRGFVRQVTHEPEPTAQKKIGRFEAITLLIVVLDVVLLYWELQPLFENPLFQFALKIAPWLLGATAFTYSDKARAWLLGQCQRRWLGILAVALLPLLVILTQPVFSVRLRVDSDSMLVTSGDKKVDVRPPEAKLIRVILPDLAKPYRISIEDHRNEKYSYPSSITLGRFRVVRATFAQIPWIGESLFGPAELSLTPLYRVFTKSSNETYADIEGKFQDGFFQRDSLTDVGCSPVKAANPELKAVRCRVQKGDDAFRLPAGLYEFTLHCDDHTKRLCSKEGPCNEVKEGKNETIDFDQQCSQ